MSRRGTTWSSTLVCSWTWLSFLAFSQWVFLFLRCFFVANTFLNIDASTDCKVSRLSCLWDCLFLPNIAWATIGNTVCYLGIIWNLLSALACLNLRLLVVCLDRRWTLNNWGWNCDIARTIQNQGWERGKHTISLIELLKGRFGFSRYFNLS